MDLNEMISRIEKASGITELAQVTKLEGHLEGVGTVEVSVSDRGEGEQYRYTVWARPVEGDYDGIAMGNPERELDTAIAVVHWDKLQR